MPAFCKRENNCVDCLKKNLSLLNGLSTEELALLDEHRSYLEFKKNEHIFKRGEIPAGLLILNKGKIKLIHEISPNKEITIAFFKPVEFINVPYLFSQNRYPYSAIAIENSAVCLMEKDALFKVIHRNPDFVIRITQWLAKEYESATWRLLHFSQKNLLQRTCLGILTLKEIYGFYPDGRTLNCSIKRKELASLTHMDVSNIIRTLSLLQKKKIIAVQKRTITILDIEQLTTLAAMK